MINATKKILPPPSQSWMKPKILIWCNNSATAANRTLPSTPLIVITLLRELPRLVYRLQ